MAVENIVIELSADATKLQPVIDQLVKMGQVTAKDAEDFKKLTVETQKLTTETQKTTEAYKQSATAVTQASAAKEAALQKEATRLKELEQLSKKAADPASAQKFAAAIKESENRIKGLNAELSKTPKPIREADTAFKSLRTQLLEARNEAVRLAEKFGEFSPQAIAAANAAAKIDDKVKDLNRTIAALNPEQRLGAFLQIGTGISGAFTAAQGAMALFGSESEDVQKALLKVQGALALTQGLQSVLGLKDAFRDLRILLGITATAQAALNTNTATGAVVTGVATTATKGFTAALAANPIIAIVTALGLLVAAFTAVSLSANASHNELDENTFSLEENTEAVEKNIKARNALNDFLAGVDQTTRDRIAAQFFFREQEIKDIEDKIELLEFANKEEEKTLEILTLKEQLLSKQKQLLIDIAAEEEGGELPLGFNPDELRKLNVELDKIRAQLAEIDRIRKEQQSGGTEQAPLRGITQLTTPEETDPEKEAKEFRDSLERRKQFEKDREKVISDAREKSNQKELELQQRLNEELENLGRQFLSSFFDILQNQFNANIDSLERLKQAQSDAYDEDLQGLEDLNKNKIISDGKYAQDKKKLEKEKADAEIAANRRIAEEKRKAFIAQRAASISQVAINTAVSIAKTASELGYPAAIPFIALAAAEGAAQLAVILSQPIPKFKKGILDLQGAGTGESDSIHAMLSKGESVMTARETKMFMPTLSAIRKNLIPAEVMNKFVVDGNGGKVEAYIDTNLLNRANKKILPQQADLIGRSVAKYINRNSHWDSIRGEYVN